MAAAKESPLVAILPTGGGKSLVFMVPAMLSGSGVTIVVAPYAELKRQLVTRCIGAGLDCKHWPEARESWPRVVLVSAEAASSDDFLQWAADLRVRGNLDRVVVRTRVQIILSCVPGFQGTDPWIAAWLSLSIGDTLRRHS